MVMPSIFPEKGYRKNKPGALHKRLCLLGAMLDVSWLWDILSRDVQVVCVCVHAHVCTCVCACIRHHLGMIWYMSWRDGRKHFPGWILRKSWHLSRSDKQSPAKEPEKAHRGGRKQCKADTETKLQEKEMPTVGRSDKTRLAKFPEDHDT